MSTTTIDAVQLFVKALHVTMPQADYDALPDRKAIQGLPVSGLRYRDDSFPGTVFLCSAGANWSRYNYEAFSVEWSA